MFARLRLRSLVTVCWALHDFTDLELEVQEEIFGELNSELLVADWGVDRLGNVVDGDGRARYDRWREEVRPPHAFGDENVEGRRQREPGHDLSFIRELLEKFKSEGPERK